MEVGSLRETILIAKLVYVFGEKNVDTEISIIQPETDVLLFGDPISIKTKTGKGFGSIKVSWTVDPEKALEFAEGYTTSRDYKGIIDEVGIWEDELNSSSVTELFGGGAGFGYPFTTGTNLQINIGDAWKEVPAMQINIGDAWKEVVGAQINIGDSWKEVF